MGAINTAITCVNGYVPEYRLTNKELEKMVDTTEDWILTRTGIHERRILKGDGLGTSDMGAEAVKGLLEKSGTSPDDIDMLICATVTPDMHFPATANIISDKVGIKKAFSYDINAACSSFLYALDTAARFIETGTHKKIIVVGADKMSSIVDYTDRQTCIIFGDGAAAVLLEPTIEDLGIMDSLFRSDGSGRVYLHMKAGGSIKPATYETIDAKEHYIYQEGQPVFKFAVKNMADVTLELMANNKLNIEDISWLIPHQANIRIIEAIGNRMGMDPAKVMINIQKYGNTTSATIPLCLWDWEKKLKKGDKIILSAFGGGFTWGSIYIKWAYNS